jgi:hypothetical protein
MCWSLIGLGPSTLFGCEWDDQFWTPSHLLILIIILRSLTFSPRSSSSLLFSPLSSYSTFLLLRNGEKNFFGCEQIVAEMAGLFPPLSPPSLEGWLLIMFLLGISLN